MQSSHSTLYPLSHLSLKSLHTNNFINRIVIIKSNKSEASLLSTLPVFHDLYGFNLSIFFKVFPQIIFFCIFLNSTNKYFLYSEVCPRLYRILQCQEWNSVFKVVGKDQDMWLTGTLTHLPGNCSLWFNHASINLMWSSAHGSIHLLHTGVSHKAKASGTLCLWVSHHLQPHKEALCISVLLELLNPFKSTNY